MIFEEVLSCPKCGEPTNGSRFCTKCGNQLLDNEIGKIKAVQVKEILADDIRNKMLHFHITCEVQNMKGKLLWCHLAFDEAAASRSTFVLVDTNSMFNDFTFEIPYYSLLYYDSDDRCKCFNITATLYHCKDNKNVLLSDLNKELIISHDYRIQEGVPSAKVENIQVTADKDEYFWVRADYTVSNCACNERIGVACLIKNTNGEVIFQKVESISGIKSLEHKDHFSCFGRMSKLCGEERGCYEFNCILAIADFDKPQEILGGDKKPIIIKKRKNIFNGVESYELLGEDSSTDQSRLQSKERDRRTEEYVSRYDERKKREEEIKAARMVKIRAIAKLYFIVSLIAFILVVILNVLSYSGII